MGLYNNRVPGRVYIRGYGAIINPVAETELFFFYKQ